MIRLKLNQALSSVHTIFPTTIALILGISWQTGQYPLLCVSGLVTLLGVLCSRRHFYGSGLVLVIFCVGAGLVGWQMKQQYTFYQQVANQKIALKGTIKDITKLYHARFGTLVTFRAHQLKLNGSSDWQRINKTFELYLCARTNLEISDYIQLDSVTINQPHDASYTNYLIKEGIAGTIFFDYLPFTLLKRPAFTIRKWIWHTRHTFLNNLKSRLSPKTYTLFCTIFLGKKKVAPEYVRQIKADFAQWGISHYLARSGLHMMLFVMILSYLLRFVAINYTAKIIWLLLASLIYFFMSWSSISFMRSLTAYVIYQSFALFDQQTHLMHVFCLSTFLLLMTNPLQLLFLDFQLSFSLAYAILWFAHLQTPKVAKTH